MTRQFTLEYWMDDEWYVGRLQEVPGVFSQGETLAELEQNIQEVYELLVEDQIRFTPPAPSHTKELSIAL
ncbi:MAG TPA: type II toxin-antitoxin system HicB family antitoxin [Anaerolineae bacterium]|nr:type II toxin-antitoxin system HicB family antitoxin [Anaerolineae bacterium]HNU03543.1 type II toxin-antitoxin system HicB family antitoxin [Anaerolineae bacterium]HNU05378.1 type II toxin-antitoxin system HicB family antitoxin [Anaerolineae bacterium]